MRKRSGPTAHIGTLTNQYSFSHYIYSSESRKEAQEDFRGDEVQTPGGLASSTEKVEETSGSCLKRAEKLGRRTPGCWVQRGQSCDYGQTHSRFCPLMSSPSNEITGLGLREYVIQSLPWWHLSRSFQVYPLLNTTSPVPAINAENNWAVTQSSSEKDSRCETVIPNNQKQTCLPNNRPLVK